jgi:hypothetical protein
MNRTLNLRIKNLIRSWPLTCSFTRKPFLTCVFLFRLLPTVHGRFWLARGFFVGLGDAHQEGFPVGDIESGSGMA